MTYEEIRTKFQIEYDKEGNSFSSYPSLTDKEIDTVLDKAYLALIAQKVTGNNPRRSTLESDTKAVSDIQPLICTIQSGENDDDLKALGDNVFNGIDNERSWQLPSDFLYYVSAVADFENGKRTVDLVSHENAKQFFATETNHPWIKNAIAYIESNVITILYDPYVWHTTDEDGNEIPDVNRDPVAVGLSLTYIHRPIKFDGTSGDEVFQLNDSMAEELINLAIIMALENVESSRLTTKVQTRPLEA